MASRKLSGATALVVLGGLALHFFVSTADADSSNLQLVEIPGVPIHLGVRYRPASALAKETQLRVRGIQRSGYDVPPVASSLGVQFSANLLRTEPPYFEGEVFLRPNTVYAILVVESAGGRSLDTNGGQFWEYLAKKDDGRPSFQALRERFVLLQYLAGEGLIDWSYLWHLATGLTDAYAENPEAWFLRAAYDLQFANEEERDRLLRKHRNQFRRLDWKVKRAVDLESYELAGLAQYADLIGDRPAAERYKELISNRFPEHRLGARHRALTIWSDHEAEPVTALRLLEQEWANHGAADLFIPEMAFTMAKRSGDPAATLRWAIRWEALAPHNAAEIAQDLVLIPALHKEGLERLRRLVRQLERLDDALRPVYMSRPDYEAQGREKARELLEAAGRAMIRAEGGI